MQPTTVSEGSSLRLNPHSRTLWVTFPRVSSRKNVMVTLFDPHRDHRKFNLPVVSSNATGIEIRLPQLVSGFYGLQIKDGKNVFSRQIALQ